MGMCVAGGAYLPVMTDKVLMTEGSGLFLAGPALVQAAIGQKYRPRSWVARRCTLRSPARWISRRRTMLWVSRDCARWSGSGVSAA